MSWFTEIVASVVGGVVGVYTFLRNPRESALVSYVASALTGIGHTVVAFAVFLTGSGTTTLAQQQEPVRKPEEHLPSTPPAPISNTVFHGASANLDEWTSVAYAPGIVVTVKKKKAD